MRKHPRDISLILTITLLALAAAGAWAAERKPKAARDDNRPTIDAANFTHVVDNPCFQLVPDTTFTFIEKKWYARGIGVVRTESSSGEVATLISVTKE